VDSSPCNLAVKPATCLVRASILTKLAACLPERSSSAACKAATCGLSSAPGSTSAICDWVIIISSKTAAVRLAVLSLASPRDNKFMDSAAIMARSACCAFCCASSSSSASASRCVSRSDTTLAVSSSRLRNASRSFFHFSSFESVAMKLIASKLLIRFCKLRKSVRNSDSLACTETAWSFHQPSLHESSTF